MSEQLIVSLEAREGKNPGEAIATYNRRHIVFLPRGTPPEATIRVVLEEITTKKDSQGRTMYRAMPAPVEYSERWKDNDNGTISKITVSKDWLGKEAEEGVIETRQPATREGNPSIRTERQVCWGLTLATCAIDVVDIMTVPTEVETVQGGQLIWRKTSEREEKSSSQVAVTEIRDKYPNRGLPVAVTDGWVFTLGIKAQDGSEKEVRLSWLQMPTVLKNFIEGQYPPCHCSRLRCVQNSDGYAKCEKCREEEHCVRCGKQAKVAVITGRLICADCKPYEEKELLVNRVVTVQQRQAIAQQAIRLLAGNAVPGEAGGAIMRSTLGHVESEWKRNDLAQKYAGYAWYYFCDEGVYGSKFPPAALQILQGLPQATGNGLVELAAWLAGYQRSEECRNTGDFYFWTQVEGKAMVPALHTEDSLCNLRVAVKLRSSEAERIKALEQYQVLVSRLGQDAEQARAVAEILNSDEQDYIAALAKMREVDELFAAVDRGETLVNFGGHFRVMGSTGQAQYWVIGPDGNQREPDNISYRKRYSSEGEKHWTLVKTNELAISWFKSCTAADHEFVVNKLPLRGCTSEQLVTVASLEQEIEMQWTGSVGMSGRGSPGIGRGWNLKPVPKTADATTETIEKGDPVDLSTVTTLFGVAVERRKK